MAMFLLKKGPIKQAKISHYKLNWESDNTAISVNTFENMQQGTQKYWEPVLDYNLNVKAYRRKREDQIINTNRIATVNITSTTGTLISCPYLFVLIR